MKVQTFLFLQAVVAFAVGIAVLVAPVRMLAILGPNLRAGGGLMAQLLASALLGAGVTCFVASRELREPAAARPILAGLALFNTAALVIILLSRLTSVTNERGWSVAALHALLAAGSIVTMRRRSAA